jgi:hypothetical protein
MEAERISLKFQILSERREKCKNFFLLSLVGKLHGVRVTACLVQMKNVWK